MKIAVLGAGGILGQHMIECVPEGVDATFTRRRDTRNCVGVDLTKPAERMAFLNHCKPDVIVNLAGEGRTDVVEKSPSAYESINVRVPEALAIWVQHHKSYLVQVSSQGVFDGHFAPYARTSLRAPINMYGDQKMRAEDLVIQHTDSYCIARPTFVLGARPHLREGRPNPFEQMLMQTEQRQVADRWFSVSFARDAAHVLWQLALDKAPQRIEHVGHPFRFSRHELAVVIAVTAGHEAHIVAVEHDKEFPHLAQRPLDTTYAPGCLAINPFPINLHTAIDNWRRVSKESLVDEKGNYAGP